MASSFGDCVARQCKLFVWAQLTSLTAAFLMNLLLLAATALSPSRPPPLARRHVLSAAAAAISTCCSSHVLLPARAFEPDVPLTPLESPPEPAAAQKLLALVDGRRPADWRDDERPAVDALIDELARLQAPWPRDFLRGKWKLSYLQPGPGGAGVDRRIPFPELPDNDSFQIFGESSVTKVGELLGTSLEVRVSGSLAEEDRTDLTSPKRFRADIDRGRVCAGPAEAAPCVPLPISGVGLFDGVYLGRRLRIGQNLNGGGARIVQVRVD